MLKTTASRSVIRLALLCVIALSVANVALHSRSNPISLSTLPRGRR